MSSVRGAAVVRRLSSHRNFVLSSTAVALAVLFGLLPTEQASAVDTGPYGYEILGTLGGSYSVAYRLSADGSVVIGMSTTTTRNNAFRWTAAGGMTSIHDPSWNYSYAFGVSGDGATIVGYWGDQNYIETAYVWTQALGAQDLTTLGGAGGTARAVNHDGTVIVGRAQLADNKWNAVRWVGDTHTPYTLGTLGGASSDAMDVSGDGLVIVGESSTASGALHAFRWVGGTMTDLGTFGGSTSQSLATNSNGSVVVGHAWNAQEVARAFRWEGGTMVDLGTLGGDTAYAKDVNSDGSVVVGGAQISSGAYRAFRWTSAGMVSVEDWLRAGGITVAADFTSAANGISDDGSVVVGIKSNSRAFIARLAPTDNGGDDGGGGGGSGIIDIEEFNTTLVTHPTARPGVSHASTVLHGAHGEPMRNLLDPGRQSFSLTTDAGYDSTSSAKGGFAIGDIGYGIGLDGGITARVSAGGLNAYHSINSGGDFTTNGFYVAPEASVPVFEQFYATFGGYYSSGRMDVNRGYLNGGVLDYSRGQTGTEVWGAKFRLDWLDAFTVADTSFTPYLGLTYTNARMDGYTETGGGFPVVFDAVTEHATVARIGLDMVSDLTEGVRLTGKLEASYRFEEKTATTTGRMIGLSGFNLAGQDINQFAVRAGIGAELDIGAATSFISLNGALQGNEASAWVKSGVRFEF
jgi:probable HAF family extracellular repeat protein